MTLAPHGLHENSSAGEEPSLHQGEAGETVAEDSRAESKRLLTLTLIDANRPPVLSKQFSLRADGTLDKRSGGQLEEGRARKIELDGAVSFAALLASLKPSQALMHGVFPHDDAILLSKKRHEQSRRQKRDKPVVTRTKDCTSWPTGPGVLMLDYDPPDGAMPLTPAELLEKVYEVAPELRNAPHVCRPSASSCIYDVRDGSELRGARGQRIYFLVNDARDIERAALVLQARLWMLGYGYYAVSKSGSLLERTLFDGSVFQPSRLDFAGGAKCSEGVTQRLPAPEVFNQDAPYLDTSTALPNLTGEERRRLDKLKKASRDAKAADAKVARERWIDERVGAFAATLDEPDAAKREARITGYKASCRAAIEDGRLNGDFEIVFDDGTTATVGEILDNPGKYHNRKTLDPLEPDYKGGRPVGWLNLRASGRPYLWSFAHGGRRYQLIRARRTISLLTGERADVFMKVMELLRLDGALYERGGLLTRIVRNRTVVVIPEWLLLHLDRTLRFESLRKNDEGEFVSIPADAPVWLAMRIVKADGERGLPQLNAVLDAPTMDPKTGRIIAEDGFDEATGLYMQLPPNVEPINQHVAEAEAHEALKFLWRPFETFPFADAQDDTSGRTSRSVFLAAILTAVVRRLLATAPGFLISATAPGSGKTLLALCLATLMSAETPDVLGVPEGVDENEMSKLLLAKAMASAPTLFLDNVAGMFKSAALCAFITSPVYEGRILGLSQTASVLTNSLLVLTGNHPIIVGDLNRRLLRCELDPRMEAPHKRAFKLDPLEHCREHRLDMVRSALTVLKAWHNAGRPKFTPDRTASVETWSDTIRQCVIWIGRNGWLDVADPNASIDAGFEADPDTRKLDALLRAWEAEFGAARQPVKALRPYAENSETELFEALDEIGAIERGALNPRRLGRWIEQRAGRVVAGRRFVQDGSRSNALLWRVEALRANERRSEDGEFGGFGEFSPAYAGNEKSNENGNGNGLKQSHQTHQTHRSPPWRRSTEDVRGAKSEA
jgi:hypothetical protein